MKKRFLVLLFAITPLFSQGRTLTLEESINLTIENNHSITISKSKVAEADAKVNEVGSYMLPKISVGATYARLSDVPAFEVNIPAMPAPIKIQDAILNNYSLKASFQQPLFTGFRLSSLKNAAQLQKSATEQNYKAELNNSALEASAAFWNVYRAEKILYLTKEMVKRAKSHLNDTKKYFDNGLVTKSDYLKVEVMLSNSKVAELEAQNALKLATAQLNKTIGLPLIDNTKISTKDLLNKTVNENFSDVLEEGLKNRNELKAFSYRLNATEENVTAANSGWYPNVSLFGNFYYSNPNQRIMPLEDKFYDTWDVGVALNWNIWDWGETSSKAVQAKELKLQTETSLEMLKENIQLEIYNAFLNIEKESEKVALNDLSCQQAKENLRIVEEQYSVQMASSSDLIDAETTLRDAEVKLISAKIDQEIARLKLNKAVGRKLY